MGPTTVGEGEGEKVESKGDGEEEGDGDGDSSPRGSSLVTRTNDSCFPTAALSPPRTATRRTRRHSSSLSVATIGGGGT